MKKGTTKTTNKVIKEGVFKRLVKTFFYNTERTQLSRTALMSFVFFLMAVTTWVVGIILPIYTKGKVKIPDNILTYIVALTTSGFLQYSYGKGIKAKSNKKVK